MTSVNLGFYLGPIYLQNLKIAAAKVIHFGVKPEDLE